MDEDIQRECRDCSRPFTLTPGEQRFYAAMNYPLPVRCAFCRAARRAAQSYLDETASDRVEG